MSSNVLTCCFTEKLLGIGTYREERRGEAAAIKYPSFKASTGKTKHRRHAVEAFCGRGQEVDTGILREARHKRTR